MTRERETIGTSREIVAADGRRYAFADHNCFACGAENPIGMHLHIELGDATARTRWTVGDDFVGWSDKLHGGIIATLLDEVMAWAPSSFDSWAVTAEMSVRYRSPATPGEELVAEGRVVERRRRIYAVTGEVRGADGRLVATGSGRYLGATPSAKAELKERYGVAPGVGGE
ncbi:MAG TPA: PaaI family thioesterase [Candidatus Limnocylindria bacterium]|nr:PaaI family thioesterase [Candidatus Limnocylindria bacterium]